MKCEFLSLIYHWFSPPPLFSDRNICSGDHWCQCVPQELPQQDSTRLNLGWPQGSLGYFPFLSGCCLSFHVLEVPCWYMELSHRHGAAGLRAPILGKWNPWGPSDGRCSFNRPTQNTHKFHYLKVPEWGTGVGRGKWGGGKAILCARSELAGDRMPSSRHLLQGDGAEVIKFSWP